MTASTVRMMSRCPRCKAPAAVDVVERAASEFFYLTSVQGGGHEPHVRCASCGRGLHSWSMVRGVYREHVKCSRRCEDAVRPDCECSCAGRNHGAGALMVSNPAELTHDA